MRQPSADSRELVRCWANAGYLFARFIPPAIDVKTEARAALTALAARVLGASTDLPTAAATVTTNDPADTPTRHTLLAKSGLAQALTHIKHLAEGIR